MLCLFYQMCPMRYTMNYFWMIQRDARRWQHAFEEDYFYLLVLFIVENIFYSVRLSLRYNFINLVTVSVVSEEGSLKSLRVFLGPSLFDLAALYVLEGHQVIVRGDIPELVQATVNTLKVCKYGSNMNLLQSNMKLGGWNVFTMLP